MRIISTGIDTHDNDERYQVTHPKDTDDWILQIKYTNTNDEGLYECQVK